MEIERQICRAPAGYAHAHALIAFDGDDRTVRSWVYSSHAPEWLEQLELDDAWRLVDECHYVAPPSIEDLRETVERGRAAGATSFYFDAETYEPAPKGGMRQDPTVLGAARFWREDPTDPIRIKVLCDALDRAEREPS